MHLRVLTIPVNASGSVSGTIGVSPAQYAGAYFSFDDPTAGASVEIDNLNRALMVDAAVTNNKLDELAPTAWKLISGDVVVTAKGTKSANMTVSIFFDYGR